MANVKITDLTALSGALADADLFEMVDDVAGTPASRKVTAAVVREFTNMAQATGTDANTTMAINTLYVVDMSAWATADRTYTLPATAAVGDRIGVMVTAGSASYELLLTAGTGDTLNGIAGGTEWSRVFITNEVVIMRCVAANATWIVEDDGRIDLLVMIAANGSTTQTLTRNANNQITSVLSTVSEDVGANWDATNKRLTPRRAGVYLVSALVSVVNVQSAKPLLAFLQKNGPVYVANAPIIFGTGAATVASGLTTYVRMAVGDTLELQAYYEDTATNRATSAGANENYFRAKRVGD